MVIFFLFIAVFLQYTNCCIRPIGLHAKKAYNRGVGEFKCEPFGDKHNSFVPVDDGGYTFLVVVERLSLPR